MVGDGRRRRTVLTEIGRDGRTVTGWPRTAAGYASFPGIAADGTIYYAAGDRLFARARDGSMRPGWPVAIPKVYPQCGDVGPYLGPDGTVYVMAGDALHAFTRAGRRKAGWPVAMSAPVGGRLGATGLTVAAGHLYATLYDTCSGTASLVALEPDGSIAR